MSLAKTIGAVHEPGKWAAKPFHDYAMNRSPLHTGSDLGEYFGMLKEMFYLKREGSVVDPRLALVMPFAKHCHSHLICHKSH